MAHKHNRRSFAFLAALAVTIMACTCSPFGLGLGGGGDLGDYVWFDADGDGQQDEAERGVGGVTVRLLDEAGATVQETQTDGDGLYGFTGVESGEYALEFIPPAEMAFTLRDVGGDDAADSDARQADGQTEPFEYSGGDDSRDAGLVEMAAPTPAPTQPPVPTETPTPQIAIPEFFITYEHTMPGSYSEIIIVVSGVEPGQTVEGAVLGPAVDGDGSFSVTADAEGNGTARVQIFQFGTYEVDIPQFAVSEIVNVTAEEPAATPES